MQNINEASVPEHSPLPWSASPTGQIYDANNVPLIGVGAFNSRWDAAFVRDAVSAPSSPTTVAASNAEAVRERIQHLVGALQLIARTEPQTVMNGNARMGDPDHVKVGWNFHFMAREAINAKSP